MAQLLDFGGGRADRLQPHLIGVNQAVTYTNIDNATGSLVPLPSDEIVTTTNIGTGSTFVRTINGQQTIVSSNDIRDYVFFQDGIYYSDRINRPKKIINGTEFNLGIVPPVVPTVSVDVQGLTGTIVYGATVSWQSGATINDRSESSLVGASITVTNGVIDVTLAEPVSSDPSFISPRVHLYRQNPSTSVYESLAVFDPGSLPRPDYRFRDTGGLTGTTYPQYTQDSTFNSIVPVPSLVEVSRPRIQYAYTYVSSLGRESAPSPLSDVVTPLVFANVTLVASSDTQVSNIRLYRIGGNLTELSLVNTFSNTNMTYQDTIGNPIDGAVNNSANNGVPPIGLKFLTSNNSVFFGALDDTLYYSEVADPDAWGALSFLDFDSNITGLGVVQNGLLVFTLSTTFIITGTTPDTFAKYLLNGNIGCVSHKSIQYLNNNLLWLSLEGICASTGGNITVVSRPLINIPFSTTPNLVRDSAVLNEEYHLFYNDGVVIMDTRYGVIFKDLDLNDVDSSMFDETTGNLYYTKNSALYNLYGGNGVREITYKSGQIGDGSINELKNYESFYVRSVGNITLKIFIDSNLISTTVINGIEEIKIPIQYRRGYFVEFEVTGDGILKEIEYKIEGRQNGK